MPRLIKMEIRNGEFWVRVGLSPEEAPNGTISLYTEDEVRWLKQDACKALVEDILEVMKKHIGPSFQDMHR